jgi:hypothetical protein
VLLSPSSALLVVSVWYFSTSRLNSTASTTSVKENHDFKTTELSSSNKQYNVDAPSNTQNTTTSIINNHHHDHSNTHQYPAMPPPTDDPPGLFESIAKTLKTIWTLFLSPLGIAFIQILTACFKSAYYGPFGTQHFILDGVLGAPDPESYDRYPFEHSWRPSGGVLKVLGCILGLGLGLRNYVECLLGVVRCSWYGAFPEKLNSPDGFFTMLPGAGGVGEDGKGQGQVEIEVGGDGDEEGVYRTSLGRILGFIFGLGVGIRFILNGIFMALKGFCYGPEPDGYHLSDGLLVPSGITHASQLGKNFGYVFGLGVGLYPAVNFLTAIVKGVWYGGFPELFEIEQHFIPIGSDEAYSTTIGCALGWIFGIGVGLFGIINGVLLIPCAAYYGAMGEKYFTWGVLGPPQFPMRTGVGLVLGYIFGLYFGFRSLLDIILTFVTHFWSYVVMFL